MVGAALLQSIGWASPAGAQVYVGVDAVAGSPYVWRVVTRADGWVAQPGGFVSVKVGGGFLPGGAWPSYELGPAGPGDLSDLCTFFFGVAEVTYLCHVSMS